MKQESETVASLRHEQAAYSRQLEWARQRGEADYAAHLEAHLETIARELDSLEH